MDWPQFFGIGAFFVRADAFHWSSTLVLSVLKLVVFAFTILLQVRLSIRLESCHFYYNSTQH